MKRILLTIFFGLWAISANATVQVKALTGQPVQVCQPSDPNSNCGGGGGGSQTPWVSNIDGGGYTLSDVSSITASSFTSTGTAAGSITLNELPANGSTYTGFTAPATVSTSGLYPLPAADGTAGYIMKTLGSYSGLVWFNLFGTGNTWTANQTFSAINLISDTTTGVKIGTATSQKWAFWNATPIVQPSGDIITALTNLGLIASPTISQADVTSLVASGKTVTFNNSLTFAGTDSTTITTPSTSSTMARTDAAQTFSGLQTFGSTFSTEIMNNAEYSNSTCTTSKTIDPANGNRQKITLTNGDACALTFTQPASGTAVITLKVIQSTSSSYNGTISGCKWPGGTVMTPTATTGAIDVISIYLDGTNAYCAPVGQAFS